MKSVWLLTSEYNDYDQYGRYYEQLYSKLPTTAQLIADGVPEDICEHLLLHGGGRMNNKQNVWYYLEELTPK
jgi:hypothetical protein